METELSPESAKPETLEVSAEQLQAARNNLLELRQTLGAQYNSLPAPDRLIRLVDNAIELIPGEGEPTQEPYNK